MRRLLLLLVAVPALAGAADFGKLSIERGYQGPLVVDVRWGDGTARDVTAATATLVVYSTPPRAGVGGVVLFQKTCTPAGVSNPNRLICDLSAADTAKPDSYGAELVVVEGAGLDATRDPVHGKVVIEGL